MQLLRICRTTALNVTRGIGLVTCPCDLDNSIPNVKVYQVKQNGRRSLKMRIRVCVFLILGFSSWPIMSSHEKGSRGLTTPLLLTPDQNNSKKSIPANTPPSVSKGRVESHFEYMNLLHKALDSDSPVLRMNLDAVAHALFQTSHRIDEPKTQPHGPDDPEVNVFTTRAAKFEFAEWLVNKAEKVEVKEMEILVLYVKGVVESMDEYYYSVRRRAGFRGEPERDLR
jgi:hypothetical protein